MTVLRVYRNDITLILSYLNVYKVVNISGQHYISFSPCSHSQWSLANTLSEVFEISVVTQLKRGEKEDFDIC